MSQLYVAALGQSNITGLRTEGDDGVSGMDVIEQTLSGSGIYSDVAISNYAVGGSAADGNYGKDEKANWWYLDAEFDNSYEADGATGAGYALTNAIGKMQSDLSNMAFDAAAGDTMAVIWSQGETDANRINTELRTSGESSVARYKEATLNVFESLRETFGDGLQIFLAKTGEHNQDQAFTGRDDDYMARADLGRDLIQQVQEELAADYDFIHLVADLGDYTNQMSDEYHYTDEAYELIGADISDDIIDYYNGIEVADDTTDTPVESEDIILQGSTDGDVIMGTAADEIIIGGGGEDSLFGGEGSDVFKFTSASDSTSALDDQVRDFVLGEDMFDVSALGYHGVTNEYGTAQGELRLTYSAAADRTYVRDDHSDFEFNISGNFVNTLDASSFIFAETATSMVTEVIGSANDDALYGTAGDDIIDGLAGEDRLEGGAGADIFRFTNKSDSTWAEDDRIVDFDLSQDKIDISAFDYQGISNSSGAAGLLKLVYSEASDRTYVRDYHDDFQFFVEGNHVDTLTEDHFIM